MSALLGLEAKRPYCIDPTREYSLVYFDWECVLGGGFEQHGQESYWFVDVPIFVELPPSHTAYDGQMQHDRDMQHPGIFDISTSCYGKWTVGGSK